MKYNYAQRHFAPALPNKRQESKEPDNPKAAYEEARFQTNLAQAKLLGMIARHERELAEAKAEIARLAAAESKAFDKLYD